MDTLNSVFINKQFLPGEFLSAEFLTGQCQDILKFYDQRVIDPVGGYFQNYYDDGSLYAHGDKHLVSSTRIIVNYALASIFFANDNNRQEQYMSIATHGLYHLENSHWQADSETYVWSIVNYQVYDTTQQAYGYAFVLLAYAAAKKAGIITSDDKILATYYLLEERFWQAEYQLYADEISPTGELSSYRGQNANMHICEALIAAYEATDNTLFLMRAFTIAQQIVIHQAGKTNHLIWEHYTENFEPDWQYNINDAKNLYRPWGFQPGHQTEWAKLLLMLNRHAPAVWLVEKAEFLFNHAYSIAWDKKHGGLIYGFNRENKWCDSDKYFWVQAESFATAALLYQATDNPTYLKNYQALWKYCLQHFIDHEHGAWFRLLTNDNQKVSNEKSSAGAKCDYHTLGACFEVLRSLA